VITVAVDRLAKTFFDESRGEVRAVDGVSFTCEAGRIFGLPPPSACSPPS
jgi:ABC-type oligopeptide transport system ATPase subunit